MNQIGILVIVLWVTHPNFSSSLAQEYSIGPPAEQVFRVDAVLPRQSPGGAPVTIVLPYKNENDCHAELRITKKSCSCTSKIQFKDTRIAPNGETEIRLEMEPSESEGETGLSFDVFGKLENQTSETTYHLLAEYRMNCAVFHETTLGAFPQLRLRSDRNAILPIYNFGERWESIDIRTNVDGITCESIQFSDAVKSGLPVQTALCSFKADETLLAKSDLPQHTNIDVLVVDLESNVKILAGTFTVPFKYLSAIEAFPSQIRVENLDSDIVLNVVGKAASISTSLHVEIQGTALLESQFSMEQLNEKWVRLRIPATQITPWMGEIPKDISMCIYPKDMKWKKIIRVMIDERVFREK